MEKLLHRISMDRASNEITWSTVIACETAKAELESSWLYDGLCDVIPATCGCTTGNLMQLADPQTLRRAPARSRAVQNAPTAPTDGQPCASWMRKIQVSEHRITGYARSQGGG